MRPTRATVAAVCVFSFLLGSAALAESFTQPPGCLLWFDASKISGNPSPVAAWSDNSGLGHDATQPDANRQPRFENGVLKFGGDDYLTVPLKRDWNGTDWTVFAVASLDADTPANYRGIIGNRFGEGSGAWWSLGTKGDGTLYLELAAGAGVTTSVLPANSTMCIYCVTKQGQQFSLYRNGRLMGTATYGDVGGLSNDFRIGMWFGDGQEWKGDIGEIILYDGAMNAPDRERMEQVLSEKWGVYFAHRLMIKESTWPATMLSSRTSLRDWSAKQGMTQLSDAAVLELWGVIETEYPAEATRFKQLATEANRTLADWFRNDKDCAAEMAFIAVGGARLQAKLAALTASNAPPDDPSWLTLVNEAGETREAFQACQRQLDGINVPALRRAIADLSASFPEQYARGQEFASQLNDLESRVPDIKAGLAACDEAALAEANAILKLQQEALLGNPSLDFDKLLLVRRSVTSPMLGLVQNWQSNCMLPHDGFDNEIAMMSPVTPDGQMTTLYKPQAPVFVGDVDLNFDADRMLFSSIGSLDRWQIFEIGADGTGLRQVTPGDEPDVDNYDPCYAPDERILFCSSAFFTAVPCVNGSSRCAVLYSMNADGSNIRQLAFDQEHNWCPTMLPNGRVLYLRWEYTDTPHSHDRVLFHMNPDGTDQRAYYGTNSYWPNSLFYARPIPDHPTQFAGIVTGHHGVPRMGELVLFDIARCRRETEGAVQRIPGWGQGVKWGGSLHKDSPLISDNLVDASWPKFLHPYPLSDKYFLVSCKPTPDSLWGIYLVDVFDNMLLLKEDPVTPCLNRCRCV